MNMLPGSNSFIDPSMQISIDTENASMEIIGIHDDDGSVAIANSQLHTAYLHLSVKQAMRHVVWLHIGLYNSF